MDGKNELTVYQAFLRSSASEETKNIGGLWRSRP